MTPWERLLLGVIVEAVEIEARRHSNVSWARLYEAKAALEVADKRLLEETERIERIASANGATTVWE